MVHLKCCRMKCLWPLFVTGWPRVAPDLQGGIRLWTLFCTFCQGQVGKEESTGCAEAEMKPCPAPLENSPVTSTHPQVWLCTRDSPWQVREAVGAVSDAAVPLLSSALSDMIISSKQGTDLLPCTLFNEVSSLTFGVRADDRISLWVVSLLPSPVMDCDTSHSYWDWTLLTL